MKKGARKKTEYDYNQLAINLGWKFSGPMVNIVSEKTNWICNSGHPIYNSYKNISRSPTCGQCQPNGRIKKTELHYNKLAEKKLITWVGDKLPDNTKLITQWKCSLGHVFDDSFRELKRKKSANVCKICK